MQFKYVIFSICPQFFSLSLKKKNQFENWELGGFFQGPFFIF